MRASASRLAVSTVLGAFLARPALAEEYKFNAQGAVKAQTDQPAFKFVLPQNGGKKNDEYVQEAEVRAENLFKAPLGYPKKELLASVNPGVQGFKNILAGDRVYNYGGSSTAGTVGARYVPSLKNDFGITADFYTLSIPDAADPAAGLVITGSSASMYTVLLDGHFCSVQEDAFHRICFGARLANDSFPTLQFPATNNSAIQLEAVHDLTLGADVRYERPMFGGTNFEGLLALDHGWGMGSSGVLATKNNDRISGSAGLQWPGLSLKWNVSAGFEYRAAKLESKQDTWDIQNVSYAGKLGIIYEWGAL